MGHTFSFKLSIGAILLAGLALPAPIARAEAIALREATDDGPIRVSTKVDLDGELQTANAEGKATPLKLTATANFAFVEESLKRTGRDAQAFASLRKYGKAQSTIQVAEQKSQLKLRDAVHWIVAEGRPDGVRVFSPHGPLTYEELDLLRTPVDSLSARALLPDEPVEVGEQWKPSNWVLPFLSGVEAVEKSSLTCKLVSANDHLARVEFSGEISGGIVGAATQITLSGHYDFDLEHERLSRLELRQTEKRAVSAVTPGLDVTARVTLERSAAATDALEGAPTDPEELEATPEKLLLLFEARAWKIELFHDRNWHLFHQNERVAVFRMLEKGSLIAQCNITPLPAARPGQHADEKDFQQDIARTLGKDFGRVVEAIKVPSQDGRYLFRVIATGDVQRTGIKGEELKLPMAWIYYLIANADGRQMTMVFTVEASLLEKFESQDLGIAGSVQFLK